MFYTSLLFYSGRETGKLLVRSVDEPMYANLQVWYLWVCPIVVVGLGTLHFLSRVLGAFHTWPHSPCSCAMRWWRPYLPFKDEETKVQIK